MGICRITALTSPFLRTKEASTNLLCQLYSFYSFIMCRYICRRDLQSSKPLGASLRVTFSVRLQAAEPLISAEGTSTRHYC